MRAIKNKSNLYKLLAKYKTLVFCSIFIFGFFACFQIKLKTAYALEWQKQYSDGNTMKIVGTCKGDIVTIYLYALNKNDNPIYSAGTKCEKGNFKFSDNLDAWNIKDNTYKIVVGEGQNNPKFSETENIEIDKTIQGLTESVTSNTYLPAEDTIIDVPELIETPEASESTMPSETSIVEQTPEELFTQGLTNFNANLTNTTESFNNMKNSIDDTAYPDYLKTIIKGFLSGMESTLGSLNTFTFKMYATFVNKDSLAPNEVQNSETEESTTEVVQEVSNTIPTENAPL